MHLDLSFNRLTSLPITLGKCVHLEELYLNNNLLVEIPMELGRLYSLKNLALDNNPLTNPPIDLVMQGLLTVKQFLRERIPAGPVPPERTWVSNKEEKPYQDKVKVVCYNVLAEDYALPDRYPYCPVWALNWNYRKVRILNEITNQDADVVCLQEVETEQYRSYFEPAMQQAGYAGMFRPKSRARTMDDWSRVDGCATFYKSSKFVALEEHLIEFQSKALEKHEKSPSPDILSRLMPKDNIAIITVLQLKENGAPSRRRRRPQKLVVANAHIHWDPEYADAKLLQCYLLLEELTTRYGVQTPMIICGDFNSTPDSGPYELLKNGFLPAGHRDFLSSDFGTLARDGLSHNLKLDSAYTTLGEPPFTNYTSDFVGVLDYVWFTTDTLECTKILEPVDESVVKATCLPNHHLCSDHVMIGCEVGFKQ